MDYFTPVKDISNKLTRSTAQNRQGDWVCLNCNNLNFSFRKRCNRCKTQTRIQNQTTQAYYYYKPQFCTHKPSTHGSSPNSRITTPGSQQENNTVLSQENDGLVMTPLIEKMTPLRQKTPQRPKRELPSVSPLVKKYALGSSARSSEGSVWGVQVSEFRQEDEKQCEQCQQEDKEEDMDQMELLLSNIML